VRVGPIALFVYQQSYNFKSTRIKVKGRENERTGREEEVDTLEEVVDETEDVEVVLELDLEVVDTVGDRIPERMPGIKPGVVDVAGVFLSFPADCVDVGGVSVVSKKLKRPYY
jgi:hypothetical protein